jgi:hypothetical protein
LVAKKTASSVQPVGAPPVKHVEPATAVESVDVALTATAPTIESSAVAVVVTTCAPLVQHVAASPVEHVQPGDVVTTVIPNDPVAVGTTAPRVVDSAPTAVASVPHPVDIASVAHPVDIAMTSAPVEHVVGATTLTQVESVSYSVNVAVTTHPVGDGATSAPIKPVGVAATSTPTVESVRATVDVALTAIATPVPRVDVDLSTTSPSIRPEVNSVDVAVTTHRPVGDGEIIILVDTNVHTIAQLKQLELQKQKMDCCATSDLIPHGNKIRTEIKVLSLVLDDFPLFKMKTIPPSPKI